MSSRPSEFASDSFVAASGTSLHLLRQDLAGGAAFGEVVVSHGAAVNAARWNRNNKVVASGCADGTVQLLYASGQVMCVLPRDGSHPAAYGSIAALSWSAGSKRLAAGSSNGSLFIFDMQQKVGLGGRMGEEAARSRILPRARDREVAAPSSCISQASTRLDDVALRPANPLLYLGSSPRVQQPTVELGGHVGGVTALEYQHDDKFLAVARCGTVRYCGYHSCTGRHAPVGACGALASGSSHPHLALRLPCLRLQRRWRRVPLLRPAPARRRRCGSGAVSRRRRLASPLPVAGCHGANCSGWQLAGRRGCVGCGQPAAEGGVS